MRSSFYPKSLTLNSHILILCFFLLLIYFFLYIYLYIFFFYWDITILFIFIFYPHRKHTVHICFVHCCAPRAWNHARHIIRSDQISRSVVSDSLWPMNHSTPGLPVHHQLPEFTQTHAHWVSDAIQPSHPLSCPSPPAPNPSQHQSLFQWVNSSHEVAKVLEFQL